MEVNITREDIIKELMNLYIGQAASLMSEITNRKIILSVPEVKILIGKEQVAGLVMPECQNNGALMVSSIKFEKDLEGMAKLIFPANKIKKLTSIVLEEDLLEEDFYGLEMEFSDTDYDIVKELGNIVLNSVVGGIANLIDICAEYSMPQVKLFENIDYEKLIEPYSQVLLTFVNFNIENEEIFGAIIIQLAFKSMKDLLEKVEELRSNVDEQDL